MPRIIKVTTRKGDEGVTSLADRQRVPKDSPRIHAVGAVDELNSVIGLALAQGLSPPLATALRTIQNELFHLGADLSYPKEPKQRGPKIEARHVAALENLSKSLLAELAPLKNFILPGGVSGAATLHLARAVCRRAERAVTTVARAESVNPSMQQYLNRLSDVLFIMARIENKQREVAETFWDMEV